MTRRRAAVIAALVAVFALVGLSRGMYAWLLHILAAARALATEHPAAAAVLVVVFVALAAMLAFVSSWVVVPFAVFTWGTTETLFLLWGGWLLGGVASYGIGRWLGRPVVHRLTSATLLNSYEARISQRSTFGLILLLQLGLPSEIPGYLLGLVRYPFAWYLAALALSELLHGVATVFLGAGLVERRLTSVIIVSAVLLLITTAAARALQRRLSAMRPRHAAPVLEEACK